MLNDLKPCPFCGEEVAFSFDMKPYNRAYEGRCIGCGMEFRYQERITIYQKKIPYLQSKPFIKAWNERI